MIIDVATDLWQRKENIRIEVPPTIANMAVSALWSFVNRHYTRHLRATAPPGIDRRDAASMVFAVEGIRLLVLDRSATSGCKWVTLDSCAQLTPYCQLYAFQAPDPRHGDAQAVIPVARMVGARPASPAASAKQTSERRSRPPCSPTTLRRHGSTTPKRGGPSPRSHMIESAADSPRIVSLDRDAEAVFRFLSTGSMMSEGSSSPLVRGSVCNTAVLSQLLNSVGVNLSHWQDPAYRFLASESACATRPFLSIDEFTHFCGAYRSLVKLIHRFLISRYGHVLPTGRAAAQSSSPLGTAAERKDWSPPRARTPPSASPQRVEDASAPRHVSPTRGSASPARRQHSVSLRLFSGLSSIPTAKDRKMCIYDP